MFSRSEWAVRHLNAAVSEGTGEEPGILLIQVDGLGRGEMEGALAAGRMPFLSHLQRHNKYELNTFYPGLPSTTPAVQAELYYGIKAGVPAFSFQDRATGKIVTMFDPDVVKQFEKQFEVAGESLLAGGSSWSNIYCGGASDKESHFCIASLGFGEMVWNSKFLNLLLFALMQFPALLRIVGLVTLEFVLGLWDAIWGILRGQPVVPEFAAVVSRMCVGIGVREAVSIGAKIDLARGLPIIHVNFLGYDELAHRRGPSSAFARWSLWGIDAAIAGLYRAAHRSTRRDYQVWIFSDHGQERARSFATEFPGGIEEMVAACLTPSGTTASQPDRNRRPTRPYSRASYEREARTPQPGAERPFRVAAMGPVGHVYLTCPMADDEKHAAARRLVNLGVPAVLVLRSDRGVTWHDAKGEMDAEMAVRKKFSVYTEARLKELSADVMRLCRHENAGELVLLGYCGEGSLWTFVAERGSHAGLGPRELEGFLLTPPAALGSAADDGFLRPTSLRESVFHILKKRTSTGKSRSPAPSRLRVMTYNVHGCIGMDGRVSPRRIARLLAQQDPDIVALQELDCGRRRSRMEDQASLIAELLGYHVVFCPTVINGPERYGHALLSRFPIETIRVASLPSQSKGLWPENRGALWVRISLYGLSIEIVTTHLGLGSNERRAQMDALLGSDWLETVLDNTPVILCGDFNCRPGSVPHGLATAKLRDAVGEVRGGSFTSARPLVRIDHIFVTRHFVTRHAGIVKNALSRVSSDHLPVVVDLAIESEGDICIAS